MHSSMTNVNHVLVQLFHKLIYKNSSIKIISLKPTSYSAQNNRLNVSEEEIYVPFQETQHRNERENLKT